ncbi:hypothetical protein K388_01926 [Streptomyces sp. KhCrAH-43]|uniref:hypothetical protein n=1 Tax=unclassified Streptomyces TaxID=2593676 RepID=UPI0003740F9C|nr:MULTISPECIES: hypothetical protein [unclassified Streptomyces]MYS34927.1 hypothetical protein [Streptomyces sp. SID4920]MYX65296.1 hypothetical protein [Streptomyces sp. SID8373]RAJ64731.1 hypothetical protein K388_01926 [Streptomyces sp. KhCrAH-43]
MARTAVPYSNLLPNGGLADPAGTSVTSGAGNGGQVANAFPELTIVRLKNASGGSGTASLLAGSQPAAIASGQGPLTVTVADGATQWIGPVESGRFVQPDGSLIVETSAAMTVTAFRVPRNT